MTKNQPTFQDFIIAPIAIFLILLLFHAFYVSSIISTVIPSVTLNDEGLYLAYLCLFFSAILLGFYLLFLPSKRFGKYANFYRYFSLTLLSLFTVFTLFDVKLYTLLGNHLYDPYIIQSIQNSGFNNEIHLSFGTVFSVLVAVLICVTLPFVIHSRLSKFGLIFNKKSVRLFAFSIPLFAFTFIVFHLAEFSTISKSFPFYDELGLYQTKFISFEADVVTTDPKEQLKHYAETKIKPERFNKKKPNILIIVPESFRSDNLTTQLMPNLTTFYNEKATIKTEHHFSGSHVSETGVFSILYGLNTYNYHTFSENKTASQGLTYLKESGYKLLGFSANQLASWNGSSFMANQFDRYIENPQTVPYKDDSLVVEMLDQFNKERNKDDNFCTVVFLNSTHHNYYFPPEYEIDKPVIEQDYNHFLGDSKLEVVRDKIFNRYKNSVRYTDHNIKKIFDIFSKEIASGELIIVVTGDHSEEFWDKGLLGHGAPNLYNCRIEVPLIFYLPNKEKVEYSFTSHQDILPTIIDYLSPNDYQEMKSFFNGSSLLSGKSKDHFVVVSAAIFERRQTLCLINQKGKYWLKTPLDNPTIRVTNHFDFDDNESTVFQIDNEVNHQLQFIFNDIRKYMMPLK